MYIGIKRWKKNDWFSLIIIVLFLAAHLIVSGYPIITWDSIRYICASFFLMPFPFALMSISYLLRPFTIFFGIWGFPVFQIAIVAYALVSILKFFNKSFIVGIVSLAISIAGYFVISVMMDIYTAVGLLSLFLVLNGNKDILLYAILSICYIAHPENLLLFPFSALIYWLIFKRKNPGISFWRVVVLFVVLVIGVLIMNDRERREFRSFPETKYPSLATRIMADSPTITRAYIKKYPDSELHKHKEYYEYAINNKDPFQILFWSNWEDKGGFIYNPAVNGIHKEAGKFIFFALSNYKFEVLKNGLNNTWRFLFFPGDPLVLIVDKDQFDMFEKWLPGQLFEGAKDSLQYKGKLANIKFRLIYAICYYLCFFSLLLFVNIPFFNRKIMNPNYYSFAVFSIIIILINACIMPNFVGIYLRYQLRIMLVPCLSMSLIVAGLFTAIREVK
jgi:hypothetical protein